MREDEDGEDEDEDERMREGVRMREDEVHCTTLHCATLHYITLHGTVSAIAGDVQPKSAGLRHLRWRVGIDPHSSKKKNSQTRRVIKSPKNDA